MFGPIGKFASNYLRGKGFEIYRPTHFEVEHMRSFWEDWLSKDIERFAAIYAANRVIWGPITQWADEAALKPSLWRYGVPEQWDTERQGLGVTGLNQVQAEVCYTDLIAFIGQSMGVPVRYLEIGVSVGKNFLPMVKHFGDVTGLDVEVLNPRVATELKNVRQTFESAKHYPVETLSGADTTVTITHQAFDGGRYIRGNQYEPDTWASMGDPFNLIFSDGVHSAKAIRDEMQHLFANNLIPESGPFAMYWDDLVNYEMQEAFVENCRLLQERFPGSWFGLHWIYGTYGARRLNGVFSTFKA